MANEYEKGKAKAEAELAELYKNDTVGGEFEEDSSISRYAGFDLDDDSDDATKRLAGNAIGKASRSSRETVSSRTAQEEEMRRTAQSEYDEERAMKLARAYEEGRARAVAKQASLKSQKGIGGMAGGAKGMSRAMGLGAAWTAYTLQALFGLISLIFFGAQGVFESVTENVVVKAVVTAVTKVISLFADIQNFAPLQDLALLFWGLSALIAIITFFAFLIMFTFTAREEIGGTPLALLATALTFACSILPVSNLFPWIVLWVIYVNAMAMYRFAKNVTGVRNLFSSRG